MNAYAWGALATVLTAAAGLVGARYTARTSKQASRYSAMLQAPEHISAGYDRLNDDLWRTLADTRASLAGVQERVTALERDKEAQHRMYRASIAYIRELLSLLTLHAPGVRLPEPPPELAEDVRVMDRKDQT